jgi:hypothetical protein
VGKAFRLFFFKIGKELGLKVNIQYLRWVEYLPDGQFERHREGIRERVLAAKKVILIVHGIIGDSKTSIQPFRRLALEDNWLVLAYDYENLNTPIEETAAVLTFVRNSWGNKAAPVTADLVAKVRKDTASRSTFWNPDELLAAHPLEAALVAAGAAHAAEMTGNVALTFTSPGGPTK